MIFARRAIQRRLDELRLILDREDVDKLVQRLNRVGKDGLSAMWEVTILHSLSALGELKHEEPLESGKKPDISFYSDKYGFIADITTISDEGFDKNNPQKVLINELQKMRNRLGLKPGGMDLRIGSERKQASRGDRVVLKLPELRHICTLVTQKIEPALKEQLNTGETKLNLKIDEENTELILTIDPRKSPYDSYGFAVYNNPSIKDSNPLYNALRSKARQLKGAEGILGIIVTDGDSQTLAQRYEGWDTTSTENIVREFLRQNSSIGFVLILSAREELAGVISSYKRHRKIHSEIYFQNDLNATKEIKNTLNQMISMLPRVKMMPRNAALRVSETGYSWGYQGGYKMSENKISISAREVMEVLSSENSSRARRSFCKIFDKWNREGRLPKVIKVIETDENEADKWIEIEVGEPDPAISSFK